jgi:hypothetical protein
VEQVSLEVVYVCDGCGKRETEILKLVGWRNISPVHNAHKTRFLMACSHKCTEKVLGMLDDDERPPAPRSHS